MKLLEKAKELGILTLPGTGSLTLATRNIRGGREMVLRFIALAATDGDPDAKTWWHVWETLTKYEQKSITLDDVCAAAGVKPTKLLKTIVAIAFETGCDVANIVASAAHPSVVAKSVKFAKRPEGIEDRKLLFQHHGFVPTPKGQTINIGVSANASAAANASTDSSVPSFLDDVESTGSTTQEIQKLIEGQLVETEIEAPWAAKNTEGMLIEKDQDED